MAEEKIVKVYERIDGGTSIVEMWTVRNQNYAFAFDLMTFDRQNEAAFKKACDYPTRYYSEPVGSVVWHYFCHEDESAQRCVHSPTGFCHPGQSYMGANMLVELYNGYKRYSLEERNERIFQHVLSRFEESKNEPDPRGV